MAFYTVTDISQAQLILCTTPDQGQVISDLLTRSIAASTLTRVLLGQRLASASPRHGGFALDGIGDWPSLAPSWQPGPSHDLAPISGLVLLFKAHEEREKCT